MVARAAAFAQGWGERQRDRVRVSGSASVADENRVPPTMLAVRREQQQRLGQQQLVEVWEARTGSRRVSGDSSSATGRNRGAPPPRTRSTPATRAHSLGSRRGTASHHGQVPHTADRSPGTRSRTVKAGARAGTDNRARVYYGPQGAPGWWPSAHPGLLGGWLSASAGNMAGPAGGNVS